MKNYNVSGKVTKASGFGWQNYLVKGATYTGTLTLQGTKKTFDTVVGNLTYNFTLVLVKSWGFNITSQVVKQLDGKKNWAGVVAINGLPIKGTVKTQDGTIIYNAVLKAAWLKLAGTVDITGKMSISTAADANMTKDDGNYDA
jgi:hypothetical protein